MASGRIIEGCEILGWSSVVIAVIVVSPAFVTSAGRRGSTGMTRRDDGM
jgi:hypothetical protein